MSWHRWLLGLLMAVAVGVPLLFSSSDTRAGNDEVKLVVMVASGWNSTGAGAQSDWIYVSKAIRDAAGSDTDVVVQPFSYVSGGAVYNAPATNQSIAASAALMMGQTSRLIALYPNARLMIVGHSEGGVVASYWLGSLAPGSGNDRLRDATVVTLDSPVAGLGMLSVADAMTHHLVSAIIRGTSPDAKGNGSAIPSDLDSADIVNFFAGPLAEIRKAAGNPNYHNGASIEDLAILASTATLPGTDTKFFHSGPGPFCAAQAYLIFLKSQFYLEGVSDLVSDPRYAVKVYLAKMFDCWMASHLAVLHDPTATAWVAGIAKGLLSKDAVKQPTATPPSTVVPPPTPTRPANATPTATPRPGDTPTPFRPTNTPTPFRPTNTPTPPRPTNTPTPPRPTDTPTPFRPTNTPTPVPVSVSVSIWTDHTDYAIGDPATVCYSVSRAGHIRITDTRANGRVSVVLDGVDDGRGDCLPGTIDGPAGTETMRIEFIDGSGRVVASDDVRFVVRAPGPKCSLPPPPRIEWAYPIGHPDQLVFAWLQDPASPDPCAPSTWEVRDSLGKVTTITVSTSFKPPSGVLSNTYCITVVATNVTGRSAPANRCAYSSPGS